MTKIKPRKFNEHFCDKNRRKDIKGEKGRKYSFMELKSGKVYRRLGKYADEIYKVIFGNLYVKDKLNGWRPMLKEHIPKGKVFYIATNP